MSKKQAGEVQAAVDRVLELAEEVEASGEVAVGDAALAHARAVLHRWIDEAKAVVVNPALGRVTLIHANSRQSTIASPDLPFTLSEPLGRAPRR